MNGEHEKTLYISNQILAGEAESASIEDGKLLIGYNSSNWTEVSFYSSDYLNTTTKNDENNKNNEKNNNQKSDEEKINGNDKKDYTTKIKRLPFAGKEFKYIILIFVIVVNAIIVKIKLKKLS